MNSVYVSTMCLSREYSLLGILQRYQAAGIAAVELGSGHPDEPGLVEALAEFPFEYSVHNYFPLVDPHHLLNIASQDSTRLLRTQQIAQRAIDLCHSLKGSFYSVHAGLRSDVNPNSLGSPLQYKDIVPYEDAFQTMAASVQELCDHAVSRGIDVLVENHVLAPFNLIEGRNLLLLMCEANEIVRFASQVGCENFGVLVDVGHLKVTANTLRFDPLEFINTISPWIRAFHLSDNDGETDQGLPFTGGAWFAPIMREFPDVPCVIEVQSGADDVETLLQLVKLVHTWRCS